MYSHINPIHTSLNYINIRCTHILTLFILLYKHSMYSHINPIPTSLNYINIRCTHILTLFILLLTI